MPTPHPPRRRRPRSGGPAGAAGPPAPGKALGAEAAAAAEAAAEAEAAAWVEESGNLGSDARPGWFRDEALDEAPAAATGATPGVTDEVAVLEQPGILEARDAPDAGDTGPNGTPDAGEAGAGSPPGTIYRTVPPLPEDAAARPHRRSPVVSVLVGLLILVVVGAGGFGIGMLLPLLIPLPAGSASTTSPPATGAGSSATPGASAGGSAGASPSGLASASPPPSVGPSPASTPVVYVVKQGDQLSRIAQSFGVTLQAIQAANGIANPNVIIPGQKLVIPSPSASASTSPVPSPSASPSAAASASP
jgi:LysM repeat protein